MKEEVTIRINKNKFMELLSFFKNSSDFKTFYVIDEKSYYFVTKKEYILVSLHKEKKLFLNQYFLRIFTPD